MESLNNQTTSSNSGSAQGTALARISVIAPAVIPKPSRIQVAVGDEKAIWAVDDEYSDRIRCDHPQAESGEALAGGLVRAAEKHDRGRVVTLVARELEPALADSGFQTEAVMPGFYQGREDCAVMGLYLDESRRQLANPREVKRAQEIVGATDVGPSARPHRADACSRLASPEDAPKIAELLGETFREYPTPSDDPDYVEKQIRSGVPFRVVEDQGEFVACASADLIRVAKTAELTDCATRPSHRRRGLMQVVLTDLVSDLEALGYPTAFTLARARVAGMNRAFHRLGFRLRGIMPQSCRIGDGIEDMNVWSRALTGS